MGMKRRTHRLGFGVYWSVVALAASTGCNVTRVSQIPGAKGAGSQGGSAGAGGAAAAPAPQSSAPTSSSSSQVAPPATLIAGTLELTPAKDLGSVTVIPNRDSVILRVPHVAGAKDYRVIVTNSNSAIAPAAGGTEAVSNANLYCAGYRQRNGNGSQVLTYDLSRQTVSRWYDASPGASRTLITIQPEVVREIEVVGLTRGVSAIVEAISEPCPFPGVIGSKRRDILVDNDETNLVSNGTSKIGWNLNGTVHSIVTEAEIRDRYFGNMIYNGQGHSVGLRPGAFEPTMRHPVVLARAKVDIAPDTTGAIPSLFFDDFNDATDPLVNVKSYVPENLGVRTLAAKPLLFSNSKWNIYAKGYDFGSTYQGVDVFVKDGRLHTVLADWKQDIMASIEAFPKKSVRIYGDGYLYVRVEVSSDATDRRYPLFGLYGPSNGDPIFKNGADGAPILFREIMHTAFFYQDTGANPSLGGWNALQIFGRDGMEGNGTTNVTTPVVDPNDPSKVQYYQAYPDTDLMVLTNRQLTSLPEPLVENFQTSGARSVVHVSPKDQSGQGGDRSTWYYRIDGKGKAVAPLMDDQMLIAPRTKYEFYIRNNRVVMYVNGGQRLCNDFAQDQARLTMTEGVLGFSHIFYHSGAERMRQFSTFSSEVAGENYHSAQKHYLENIPFIDERTWDNIGFQENVSAPADFDATRCFSRAL